MSFNNTGKVWTIEGFKEYLSTQPKNKWAKAVCLHHTAAPSLKQRPDGFKAQHLENLKSYYSKSLGWSSAPHFFTDEDQVWGMCPVSEFGVHAVSFNRTSIGIEVLGDYDSEDPKSGRGLLCWETAAKTTKLLLDYLGLEANDKTVLFHRDDPKTSKTCPGGKVAKTWVLDLIKNGKNITKPVQPVVSPSTTFCSASEVLGKKGYSDKEIAAGLKNKNGAIYWNNLWLEKAFYDGTKQETMISASEALLIPSK